MMISVKNVSKVYNSRKSPCKFAGGLFAIENKKYALKDISFNIDKGECVGIIGANGSGKSTLLKLLCGVTAATEGEIRAEGKISALLELGTGFNPEYTGISNIYLNGTLQGLSKKETKELIPYITEFADIGDYIEKPVKTYSDGMFLRLAFACAVATKPDILIVDEALAVGDFAFRQKCFSKIRELKEMGTTILMVSHDIDTVRRFCGRVIWLDKGTLRADGEVAAVSSAYMESVTGCTQEASSPKPCDNSCINRFGSAVGSILSVTAPKVIRTGERIRISCRVSIPEFARLDTLALSLSFKNSFGLDVTVISTADNGFKFRDMEEATIDFDFVCNLCPQKYSLCVSLEDRGQTPIKYYDYAEGTDTLEIISDSELFGVLYTPAEITLNRGGSHE